MHILNLTAGTHNNWGDALITRVVRQYLEANHCTVTQLELSGGSRVREPRGPLFPEICIAQTWGRRVRRILSKDPTHFLCRNLPDKPIDLMVIGGGQLLGPGFIERLVRWFLYKRLEAVDKVLFSVGISREIVGEIEQPLKEIATYNPVCFPRDEMSANILRSHGFSLVKDVVPDVVYALEPDWDEEIKQGVLLCPVTFDRLVRYQSDKISNHSYLDWWLKILQDHHLTSEQIFVMASAVVDQPCAYQLYKHLRKVGLSANHVRIRSLSGYLHTIRQSSTVISARMHPLIVGEVFGAQIIPFIRNSKLEAFSDAISLDEPIARKRYLIQNALDDILTTDTISHDTRPNIPI